MVAQYDKKEKMIASPETFSESIQKELSRMGSPLNEYMKKTIKDLAETEIRKRLEGSYFTARKLTDTPTDNLSVVNRKFVTLNGTLANRPSSGVAVVGQTYYATDTGIPMTYSSSGWKNGVGSIVASA